MKNRDVERMLRESRTLTPREELREQILNRPVPSRSATVTEMPVRPRTYAHTVRRMIPLTAAFLLVLTATLTGAHMYNTEFDTVYLDINPSAELSVNRFARIIEVRYLNADAERCFGDVALKNRNVEAGLDAILGELDADGYLENGDLYIGVSGKNEKQAEKFLEKLETHAKATQAEKGYSMAVHGEKITAEQKQAAKENGMSPNKYKMIEEIIGGDDTVDVNDLRDLNMKELRELLGEQKEHPNGKDSAKDKEKDKTNENAKDPERANDKESNQPDGKKVEGDVTDKTPAGRDNAQGAGAEKSNGKNADVTDSVIETEKDRGKSEEKNDAANGNGKEKTGTS